MTETKRRMIAAYRNAEACPEHHAKAWLAVMSPDCDDCAERALVAAFRVVLADVSGLRDDPSADDRSRDHALVAAAKGRERIAWCRAVRITGKVLAALRRSLGIESDASLGAARDSR